MTRDDIIRMAIKCQLVTTSNRDGIYADALERFSALVAQHEREVCAQICDEQEERARAEYGNYPEKISYLDGRAIAAEKCAAAIRARSKP